MALRCWSLHETYKGGVGSHLLLSMVLALLPGSHSSTRADAERHSSTSADAEGVLHSSTSADAEVRGHGDCGGLLLRFLHAYSRASSLIIHDPFDPAVEIGSKVTFRPSPAFHPDRQGTCLYSCVGPGPHLLPFAGVQAFRYDQVRKQLRAVLQKMQRNGGDLFCLLPCWPAGGMLESREHLEAALGAGGQKPGGQGRAGAAFGEGPAAARGGAHGLPRRARARQRPGSNSKRRRTESEHRQMAVSGRTRNGTMH